MYARAAGDRVGATKMDRPEWIARHPRTGDLYVTLTNNASRGRDGHEGPNPANPRAPNRHGHIMRWAEEGGDHAATRFRWETFILAGDPKHENPALRGDIRGDLFASPDGLFIDPRGVMWVQTDVSPSALLKDDHAIYGNNQVVAVDPATREARRFMTGPRGCELTGGCMTPDGRTLFVNVQHPGEAGALGTDPANPRRVSNWPDFRPDGRPRSGTVAVRRVDGGIVGT
jgi:secreted PhoX family phosphatase